MAKNLGRPAATDNADAMRQILEGAELALLPLSKIRIAPDFNPRSRHMTAAKREEQFSREALAGLVHSMSELVGNAPRGVLQPVLVRPIPGGYQLVAGERRFHAAGYANLTKIPALIKEMDDEQARAAAIIENSQRRNLDPISETREGFAFLEQLTGLESDELLSLLDSIRKGRQSDEFGLDEKLRALYDEGVATWSQTRAAVLRLNSVEQQAILDGLLNYRHAGKLTAIKDRDARANVLRDILNFGTQPSLKELQTIIGRYVTPKAEKLDRGKDLQALIPGLRKLGGEKGKQADELIRRLQELLD
ncbi:ParB/RepB/Spo0J family partition protein [Deinococcus sp. VB343]|uniref:ParB/RepB/Spo0J family partition protein n=1 Tax=Deinococcus sp. VB343 TaxID=3385567 RepID=UPI0039C97E33